MAYYNDQTEDENQAAQGEGPATLGPQGTATLGDQSTQPGGNSGGVNKPAQTPDRGSNFVGIQDYLKANQSQAGKLGDQASGVIQRSADEARQSVQGLQSQFDQDTQNAAVQNNEDLLARANEAEKLSQEEREALKKQYNANYSGPQNLQGYDTYGDALKKTQTAQSNVKNADTEEGRQQIITQINDKPRNAGITGFDSVLLQAGGGREKVNQAAQANKDVTQDLIGAADLNAQQKASDIKAQNDATRTATQTALGGVQDSFSQSLQKKMDDWVNKITGQSERLAGDVTDLELYDDTLKSYGLNEGDSIYDLDLKNYINYADPTGVNQSNVADQNDYARALALSEITGTPGALSQDTASQAGTAPQTFVDLQKFLADRTAKDTAFKDAWNNTGRLNIDSIFDSPVGPTAQWFRSQIGDKSPAQIQQWLDNSYSPYAATAPGNFPDSGPKYFAQQIQNLLDQYKENNYANQTVTRAK